MARVSTGDDITGLAPGSVRGDNPVGRNGDLLGRHPFAELIARQIRVNRPTEGSVVAVVGPWGSGKTSVLRMVKEELTDHGADGRAPAAGDVVVVEFNPWLFSGSEQLTAYFFVSLAEQVPERLGPDRSSSLAERLRRYGTALGTLRSLPGVGGLFGVGANVIGEAAQRIDTSAVDLAGQRAALADTLRELDIHLVVLIDDVDRLQTESEIRDLMRMVKLVGDLPGVTYVLSYDRRPVIAALGSDGISGQEYLEKIVQVEHRLPEVSQSRLTRMLDQEINDAIGEIAADRLDRERWPEIFAKIIQPLVATPRHVRRYGNALRLTVDLHGEEVDLVDQLAVTAIATLLPTFHSELPALAEILLPNVGLLSRLMPESHKEAAKARLEDAAAVSGAPDVARAVYSLLFPGSALRNFNTDSYFERDAQRRRRLADLEAFWTYFTAAIPEQGLTVAKVRTVLHAMKDADTLITELARWDDGALPALFERLRVHAAEVDAEDIPHVARVVAGQARQRVRSQPERIDDPARHVKWFLADLVGHLAEDARHRFLIAWACEESDPTAKLAVYSVSQYKTDNGDPLVGDDNLAEIQADLAEVVCARSPDELLALEAVGRLLSLAGDHLSRTDRAALHRLLEDDRLFARYLGIFTEPSFGGAPRPLAWRELQELLGGEWLTERIQRVAIDLDLAPELAEVVMTARQHADAERAGADTEGSEHEGEAAGS